MCFFIGFHRFSRDFKAGTWRVGAGLSPKDDLSDLETSGDEARRVRIAENPWL